MSSQSNWSRDICSPRVWTLTLGGPGRHLYLVDLEGIVGKYGNQDDAKNLWSRSGSGTTKAVQYSGEESEWYGTRCGPEPRALAWARGEGTASRQHQPEVLRELESSRGWGGGEAGLTKAAMAAPSREVTAAKETTRKMMMALIQRRKSWGEKGRDAESKRN